MSEPTGFDWSTRADGGLAISRDGQVVTVLRGRAAEQLTARLAGADEAARQHAMARATGNYRRGNERV